jgi:hypothetical protein
MAYDCRAYMVLIASPSDVHGEREEAVRVMQNWNALHSDNRRVVILPLRWETHTAPEYNVRPQEAINGRIVDDCDLVVGIFWTKLGTPTEEADSGTLEEIERVAKAGKPVMLYFSHVPVDPTKVDLKQMGKLKKFNESILSNALVETFGTSLEFRDKLASQLELKIRDLQKADGTGQPIPLDFQFVSLETAELAGNSLSTIVDIPELSDLDADMDAESRKRVDDSLQVIRKEAAIVPVALAIKNIGSSGIRNLYVQMLITPLEGEFQVSHSHPSRLALTGLTYVMYSQPSEIELKLEKLSGKGLSKEGEEWKFSFEWDALQPQRIRFPPFTYLYVAGACKAKFSAKVYADSFASPIMLHAEVAITPQARLISVDGVLAEGEKLRVLNTRVVHHYGDSTSPELRWCL